MIVVFVYFICKLQDAEDFLMVSKGSFLIKRIKNVTFIPSLSEFNKENSN